MAEIGEVLRPKQDHALDLLVRAAERVGRWRLFKAAEASLDRLEPGYEYSNPGKNITAERLDYNHFGVVNLNIYTEDPQEMVSRHMDITLHFSDFGGINGMSVRATEYDDDPSNPGFETVYATWSDPADNTMPRWQVTEALQAVNRASLFRTPLTQD
jgi:hypothetical protein